MKKCLLNKVISVLLMLFLSSSICMADMQTFLDDTMNQLNNLTVNSYQGQERGYYMGGTASIRIQQDTIQPLSVTAPSVLAGCGGIDLTMGGLSYLDFDSLVSKLEGIMASAPAFAFQLALGVLCPDCKNILDSLEAISDQINQMQVDSCTASKALVGYAGDKLGMMNAENQSSGTSDSWSDALATNVNDFRNSYAAFLTKYSGAYDCATAPDPVACRNAQSRISLKDGILELAFNESQQRQFVVPILRGILGDVVEHQTASDGVTSTELTVIPACEQPLHDTISQAIVTGNYSERRISKTGDNWVTVLPCDDITVTAANGFVTKIEASLISIRDKIESNTNLSAEEIELVNSTRIPVYLILSTAILYERAGGSYTGILSNSFIEIAARPIAWDIAYLTLRQLNTFLQTSLLGLKVKHVNNPDVMDIITAMQNNVQNDLSTTRLIVQEQWESFNNKYGESFKRHEEMRQYINIKMAENKLLESFVWARRF